MPPKAFQRKKQSSGLCCAHVSAQPGGWHLQKVKPGTVKGSTLQVQRDTLVT